tara:strand:- start:2 stop:382 length:381 start_codon:yes stop_codon:yes gene_type:complete
MATALFLAANATLIMRDAETGVELHRGSPTHLYMRSMTEPSEEDYIDEWAVKLVDEEGEEKLDARGLKSRRVQRGEDVAASLGLRRVRGFENQYALLCSFILDNVHRCCARNGIFCNFTEHFFSKL